MFLCRAFVSSEARRWVDHLGSQRMMERTEKRTAVGHRVLISCSALLTGLMSPLQVLRLHCMAGCIASCRESQGSRGSEEGLQWYG